jgi:hypothetical protein
MYQTIHIRPSAAPKPAWGEPCNGCGVCCATEPCPVGMLISRQRQGACKALLWNAEEGRYRCGVVSEPQRFVAPRWLAAMAARFAMRMISAGSGCDCDLTVEPLA